MAVSQEMPAEGSGEREERDDQQGNERRMTRLKERLTTPLPASC